MDKLISDATYYGIGHTEKFSLLNVTPVTPPKPEPECSGNEAKREHNQNVKSIQ